MGLIYLAEEIMYSLFAMMLLQTANTIPHRILKNNVGTDCRLS